MFPTSADTTTETTLASLATADSSWYALNTGGVVVALMASFALFWVRGFMRQRRWIHFGREFAPLVARPLLAGDITGALAVCEKYGERTHIAAIVLAGLREQGVGTTQAPGGQAAARMQTAMELATRGLHRTNMRAVTILYVLALSSLLVAVLSGQGLPVSRGVLPAVAAILLAAWLHRRARRCRNEMRGTAANLLAHFFAQRLTCVKCRRQSDALIIEGGELKEGYAGFGECPQCHRVWCSRCYVRSLGEATVPGLGGIALITNQCPECHVALAPPRPPSA